MPAFMSALLSGQNGPAATGGVGLSSPLTLGSLASSMGAGPGGLAGCMRALPQSGGTVNEVRTSARRRISEVPSLEDTL